MSHRNTFYYDQASNVTCVRDDDLGLTYYTYNLLDRATSVMTRTATTRMMRTASG